MKKRKPLKAKRKLHYRRKRRANPAKDNPIKVSSPPSHDEIVRSVAFFNLAASFLNWLAVMHTTAKPKSDVLTDEVDPGDKVQ